MFPRCTSAPFAICAVALFLLSATAHAAEPWPQPDRTVRGSATTFTSFASEQYGLGGETFELLNEEAEGSVQSFGLEVDARLALLDRFVLYWGVVYKAVTLQSPFSTVTVDGLGDFTVGARWQLTSDTVDVAAFVDGTFPTGYTADPGPFMPTLGSGVPRAQALVAVGKRFDFGLHLAAFGGYRLRGARPARGGGLKVRYTDQVPYGFDVGYEILDDLRASALLDGTLLVGSASQLESIEFHPTDESWIRAGAKVDYRFWKLAYLTARYVTTLTGANTFRLQHVSLGITGYYRM